MDLDDFTHDVLVDWRAVREAWREQLGGPDTWTADACARGHRRRRHGAFRFAWPDGRHLNPDWISHEFKRLCRDASVPAIRLHDVRHTYASLMLASGENLKVVQERLGWSSAAFMLKTYTHLVPACSATPPSGSCSGCSPAPVSDGMTADFGYGTMARGGLWAERAAPSPSCARWPASFALIAPSQTLLTA